MRARHRPTSADGGVGIFDAATRAKATKILTKKLGRSPTADEIVDKAKALLAKGERKKKKKTTKGAAGTAKTETAPGNEDGDEDEDEGGFGFGGGADTDSD